MAAIYGSFDIWSVSVNEVISKISKALGGDFNIVGLIIVITTAILGPVTVVANAIIVAAVWKDPYKQLRSSPSNIIIASMACCDFLVGISASIFIVSYIISLANEVTLNMYFSQVAFGLITSLIGLSVLHIFALTTDRVIAVVQPLHYKSRVTKKRAWLAVFSLWALQLLMALLQIPLMDNYYVYSLIFFLVLNVLITVNVIMAIVIICRVWKPSQKLQANMESGENIKTLIARNRKLTKSIILIAAVFKACFIPFSLCWMVVMTCAACKAYVKVILRVYSLSVLIMVSNSCINPILYAFRMPKFRKAIRVILNRVFCCRKLKTSTSNMHKNSGIENSYSPRTQTKVKDEKEAAVQTEEHISVTTVF